MKAKNNRNKNNTKVKNALRHYAREFDFDFDLIYLKEIVKSTRNNKYMGATR